MNEYVSEKVNNWINDIAKLAEFALSQPQANGSDLLEHLENAISHMLMGNPSLEAMQLARICFVCQSKKAPC